MSIISHDGGAKKKLRRHTRQCGVRRSHSRTVPSKDPDMNPSSTGETSREITLIYKESNAVCRAQIVPYRFL